MNLRRRAVRQALVRACRVVEVEVAVQPLPYCRHRLVLVEVEMLVLHRAPQAFNEDVVKDPPASVHTDVHPRRFQYTREAVCRKLTALVGRAVAKSGTL